MPILGKTKFISITVLTAASVFLAVGIGKAGDLDTAFTEMGVYGNYTGAQALRGQVMNHYTGGSLYIRAPQRGYSLMEFSAPSFRGGCGGIDAYAGSFSFINKAQFMALLKNIGSGALGLAFQTAIDALTPIIGVNLKNLAGAVRETNNLAQNSCQLAKGLVNVASFGSKYQEESRDLAQSWGRATNAWGDSFDGVTKTQDQAVVDGQNKAQAADARGREQISNGNLAWRALKKIPWLTDEQRMIYMSFTGTYIIEDDPANLIEPRIKPVANLDWEVDSFIVGNADGTLDDLPVLVCSEYFTSPIGTVIPDTGCTTVEVATLMFLNGESGTKSMKRIVQERMDSIANKIDGQLPLDATDRQFVGNSAVPVYKVAALASGYPGSNRILLYRYNEYIATYYVTSYLGEILRTMSKAVNRLEIAGSGSQKELVEKFIQRITGRWRSLASSELAAHASITALNNVTDELMAHERRLLGTMPASLQQNLAYSR